MPRPVSICVLFVVIISCGGENTGENKSIPQDTVLVPATSSTRVTVTDTLDLNPDKASTEKRTPQSADTVRFMVAFISKGSGIDNEQKANLDKWLAQQNVRYSISPWGREGEMNYCFPLKNTTPGEQQKFINDLKSQITKRDLVYFYENTSCGK